MPSRNNLRMLPIIGALTCLAPSAEAAFKYTITQTGPDVTVVGSGTLNVSALLQTGTWMGLVIQPSRAVLGTGPGATFSPDNLLYQGISGPDSFGAGTALVEPTSWSGAAVSIFGADGQLGVPAGQGSGQLISTGATFANATFASLGLTAGVYTWIWGDGDTFDTLTVQIVAPRLEIPEPATAVLFGAGLLGLGLVQRISGSRRPTV